MNNFNYSFGDAASSTECCPTPSTTMSEGMPIGEEGEETFYDYDDSSDNKPDKTHESNPSHGIHVHHMEHPPIPGGVYMIRTRQKPYRILSLRLGRLEFLDRLSPAWGVYWTCSERGNFLYFRNTTSGTNLSYHTSSGGAGHIVAMKDDYKAKQNFIAIRQEGGGYILHTSHPDRSKLRQVVVKEDEDGNFPREQDKGGTLLDFIDANYVRYSASLAVPGMERQDLFQQG